VYASCAIIVTEGVVGPEVFARSVAAVAPSLQQLRAHPGADGVFTHRLMFAVRYAEFHQRRLNGDLQEAALDVLTMFSEGLAPKTWWGVLLCDAVDLVRNGKSQYIFLDLLGA
jgi:nuclear pore complex protein Nup85